MAERIRLEDRECPLSSTLGIVGEWWTVLILHDVFDGYHRFDQFQTNLGISSSLLTTRLKRLVDAGILTKRRYEDHPPRYEYVLTDLGRSLRPVLVVLAAWGNSRLDPAARSMVLVDADTGVEADPVVDRPRHRPPSSTGPTSCSPPDRPPARPSSIATATPRHNSLHPERNAKSTANDARANAELRRDRVEHALAHRQGDRRRVRATVAVMKGALS